MQRLVLFDIDGTLISDHGAAREAYAKALSEVYGFEGPLDRYDFSGRTDRQITDMVLSDAGLQEEVVERSIEALWERYLEGLRASATSRRIQVLPGVAELLSRLAAVPQVLLGLVTGNIEQGARIKLAPHALNDYFSFGAFGSDSKDRVDLPPIAVARASTRSGHRFQERDVVIIGDSIYDVRCGVPHGATTIAVSTGRTPHELLAAENPDHLFSSLQPDDALLAAILGETRESTASLSFH